MPFRLSDWRLWLGIASSFIFAFLALRDVQLADTVDVLSHAHPWWLLLAVASFIATGLVKAARWKALLARPARLSLGKVFSILWIGLLLNSFAPARLGELARAYLIGESEAESKVYVLGTIAIEKTADLVFLMFSLAWLLWQMKLPGWLEVPGRATAITIFVLLPVLAFLARDDRFILRRLERISRFTESSWGQWLVRQISLGLESLRAVREPRLLLTLVLWSFLIWILGASTNYLTFRAMELNLPASAALLLLVVLQVGIAVPSSPGRIGVFHYLVVLTLSVFSVDKEVALSYSLVLYLVVFVPIALIGACCLWREKATWQKLSQAASSFNRLAWWRR